MKAPFIISVFCIFGTHLSLFGSSGLGTDADIAAAFSRSDVVIQGKVISKSVVWRAGDQKITADQARGVEEAYVKFANDALVLRDSEGRSHRVDSWEDWYATVPGKLYRAGIRGTVTAQVQISKVAKGRVAETIDTISLTWETSMLSNCEHVSAPTNRGASVSVFLMSGWDRFATSIIGQNLFLMGDRIVNPADT